MRSPALARSFRRPRLVSILFLTLAVVWPLVIVAAPRYVAARDGSPAGGASAPTGLLLPGAAGAYFLGSLICHQKPERSFHLSHVQLPVCARCFGIYAGAPIGAALAIWAGPFGRRRVDRARRLAFLAAPTLLTLALEWSAIEQPSNLVRWLAAVPLGVSLAWLIGDGLIDIGFARRGQGRDDVGAVQPASPAKAGHYGSQL